MARNALNRYGFAVVELMVAMVILAIALTFVTSVITFTSKSSVASSESNLAYIVGREQLQKLQGLNTRIEPNTLTTNRDGVEFNVRWALDRSQVPPLCTVTVVWENLSNKQDSVKIMGFVLGDLCPEINNNTAPTIRVEDLNEQPATEVELYAPVFTSTPLLKIFIDDDNIEDGDIVILEIESVTLDETGNFLENFQIRNFTLETVAEANGQLQAGKYSIVLRAKDCKPNIVNKTVEFNVLPPPVVKVEDKTVDFNENMDVGTPVGTMAATDGDGTEVLATSWQIIEVKGLKDGSSEDWVWDGTPPDLMTYFSIDNNGIVYSNRVFDFEDMTQPIKYELTIRAWVGDHHSDGDNDGKLSITIKDINDAPMHPEFTPVLEGVRYYEGSDGGIGVIVIPATIETGTIIGSFTVFDEDSLDIGNRRNHTDLNKTKNRIEIKSEPIWKILDNRKLLYSDIEDKSEIIIKARDYLESTLSNKRLYKIYEGEINTFDANRLGTGESQYLVGEIVKDGVNYYKIVKDKDGSLSRSTETITLK